MYSSQTTLNQLGGTNKLQVMIGAKNFIDNHENKSVHFSFPRSSKNKTKAVVIKLNANDYYDITFYKDTITNLGGIKYKELKACHRLNNISAEGLKQAFENSTGFYLSI